MRILRRALVAGALVGTSFGLIGAAPAAHAYCDPGPTAGGAVVDSGLTMTSGECSNTCQKTASTVNKAAKKELLLCLQ